MKARFLLRAFFCSSAVFFAFPSFSQSRPVATDIQAKAAENKTVNITWKYPQKTTEQITGTRVFRKTSAVSSYRDLEGEMPVAELDGNERSFTDTLKENGDYFYAVLAQTQRGDYKIIIPGMNATVKGVRPLVESEERQKKPSVASDEFDAASIEKMNLTESQKELLYTDQKIRKAPLPYPGTLLGFNNGRAKMSEEAKKNARELGRDYSEKPVPFKSPYFFEEDMFSPDGGDEYTLFETLRAGLAPKKYQESIQLLKDYLSVHRTTQATARAEFYLGESYYFCEEYEMAIRSFLGVQDAFPELSKKWIDSSLDLLTIDENPKKGKR